MAPKSSIPCRYGSHCAYYARGNCHFRHDVSKAAAIKQQNKEKKVISRKKEEVKMHPEQEVIYERYKRAQQLLTECENSMIKCKAEMGEINDAITRAREALGVLERKYQGKVIERRDIEKAEMSHRINLSTLYMSFTRCQDEAKCDYYRGDADSSSSTLRERVCKFFHTKEEITQFEAAEEKRADEVKENLRIEAEKKSYEEERRSYRYRYCLLGIRIKKVFTDSPTFVPDEICGLIRDYCVQREFKQASPLQHFYNTFETKPVTLSTCTHCACPSFAAPKCSLCNADLRGLALSEIYVLQTKVDDEERILVYFLHGICCDSLGLACPHNDISSYIKGDVKVYPEEEVRLHNEPGDICFRGSYTAPPCPRGSGKAMAVFFRGNEEVLSGVPGLYDSPED